ncbi:MAG: glutaredoxin family protein [Cyanobacteriota bacterium]|nr:glutaredoxin family protein [Cyanobacteriota bacterium]
MGTALLLYSRQGCCLCAGLEEKLRVLELPGVLQVVDVDNDPELQVLYGLEVPVLAVARQGSAPQLLPRVPPRLMGERLKAWLNAQLQTLG